MSAAITGWEARVLRAAQSAFFPDGEFPDPVPKLERVFGEAKPAVRTIVKLGVFALELSPVLARRSRFSRLPDEARVAWMERLRDSRGGGRGIYALIKVLLQSVAYDDVRSLSR